MTATVMTMLKHAGKVVAGAVPTALVAGLGWPALGTLVFLVVLVLAMCCWIISDDARVNRVARLLLARRGDVTSPEPDVPVIAHSDSRQRWRRKR